MGWYIPFNKIEAPKDNLTQWDYFITSIPKSRWWLGIYILSSIFWLYWILSHMHIYNGLILKLFCIFFGGLLGSLIILFALPFLAAIGLILAWMLTNISLILFKLCNHILS